MERNSVRATSDERTRLSGMQPSSQLHVQYEGRRPLFGTRTSTPPGQTKPRFIVPSTPDTATVGGASYLRRTKSESKPSSTASPLSPASTRIPRPGSASSITQRKPRLTLTESYRLAELEELDALKAHAMSGSPSPAPRFAAKQNGDKESEYVRYTSLSPGGKSWRYQAKPLDRDHSKYTSPSKFNLPSRRNSPPEYKLVTKTTSPPDDEDTRLPALVPGIQDLPPLSGERRSGDARQRSPTTYVTSGRSPKASVTNASSPPVGMTDRPSARDVVTNTSPERSFTWQVDDDFTAGDLQISDSPRIRVGSNRPFANRPSLIASAAADKANSPPRFGQRNTKLAEIRAREVLLMENEAPVEKQSVQPDTFIRSRPLSTLEEIRARNRSVEQDTNGQHRPKNTKLEEIRRLEKEGMSKEAYAAARLEEIREQNSMARSLSPDESRRLSPSKLKAVPEVDEDEARRGDAGQQSPKTPVTSYRSFRREGREDGRTSDTGATRASLADKRGDSQETLRSLARAASCSPPSQEDKQQQQPRTAVQQGAANSKQDDTAAAARESHHVADLNKKPSTLMGIKSSNISGNKENDRPKPSVGFTELRRSQSIESTNSKSSNMDALDRIEAEMKLFAPNETHSERGSVRAPSPAVNFGKVGEELASDMTPRAPKAHWSSMPTPRVVGAYVETPAPGKPRQDDHETASDPGTSDARDDADGISASFRVAAALRRRQRSRSVPRRRLPLRNSAQPPSVRQDLKDLQRLYNIDDSTMDDIEDVIMGRKVATPKKAAFEAEAASDEQTIMDGDEENKREEALKGNTSPLKLMSQSLSEGVDGVRSAKRCIERLETRVSPTKKQAVHDTGDEDEQMQSERDSNVKNEGKSVQTKANNSDLDTELQTKNNDSNIKLKSEDAHAKTNNYDSKTQTKADDVPPFLIKGGDSSMGRKSKVGTDSQKSHTTSSPHSRLGKWRLPSFLVTIMTILMAWYAAESATCSLYCRPTSCGPANPRCYYTPTSPLYFGTALPIKLDEWVLAGKGRPVFSSTLEAAEDWLADTEDKLRGRNIQDIKMQQLTTPERRKLRRRLHKRGLGWEPVKYEDASPQLRATWDSWKAARIARERVKEAREAGYVVDQEPVILGDDERIS